MAENVVGFTRDGDPIIRGGDRTCRGKGGHGKSKDARDEATRAAQDRQVEVKKSDSTSGMQIGVVISSIASETRKNLPIEK
jgi:hypothetical protein